MSNPQQHTRWTIFVNDKEVSVTGPPIDNDVNALQFGLGVSRDCPDARVRVVGSFRMPDGWHSGTNLGQFRDGELLPKSEWT